MKKAKFDSLKGINDFIYTIACVAENNYPDDSNTTLIKIRIFGEATAQKYLDYPWQFSPV